MKRSETIKQGERQKFATSIPPDAREIKVEMVKAQPWQTILLDIPVYLPIIIIAVTVTLVAILLRRRRSTTTFLSSKSISFEGGNRTPYYLFFLIFFLALLLVKKRIVESRLGLAFISVKEEEDLAEAIGIDTTKYKVLSFMLSTFFAGMTGGFYAHYIGDYNA